MVLVVVLILLVLVSLLSTTSMRNAQSSEAVSGAVRANELAIQAAELALRHCESSVVEVVRVASGAAPTFATTFTSANILPLNSTAWQSPGVWDSAQAEIYVLPLALVNQAGLRETFRRPPECLVAPVAAPKDASTTLSATSTFVITARAFGPEVPADTSRTRPKGTEVFLQSEITLE